MGRKGQTMVEYILIVVLIAIVAIAAIKIFGGRIRQAFSRAAEQVEESVPGGQ